MKNYMRLEFPSFAENIGLARVTVASFASQLGFTVPELDDIKLAISEAVTNSIVHAYMGGAGRVLIEAEIDNGKLEVRVLDEGCGILDIRAAMEPEYTTATDRMGLGFAFMSSCMDELEVESEPGRGTIVRMMKTPETLKE
jgi:stage II sporulation protein AB (anti-sigma F factor)